MVFFSPRADIMKSCISLSASRRLNPIALYALRTGMAFLVPRLMPTKALPVDPIRALVQSPV